MFPALGNGNHWVLAVTDIDGRQFSYYDPMHRPDTHGVVEKARILMTNEVSKASLGDEWKSLDLSSSPTLSVPDLFPKQHDGDSCGVFVLYVADHLERGVRPRFGQADIYISRLRRSGQCKFLKLGTLIVDEAQHKLISLSSMYNSDSSSRK